MENFRNNIGIVPEIIDLTTELTIDYPVKSISIYNKGDANGIVNGVVLVAGEPALNFSGLYPANTFTLNATGTMFKIIINK